MSGLPLSYDRWRTRTPYASEGYCERCEQYLPARALAGRDVCGECVDAEEAGDDTTEVQS